MVPREIDLEEKRVYVPTPIIQEPFFSLPVDAAPKVPEIVTPAPSSVVVEPTIPDITVSTPVATPPIPTVSEGSEPVIQEPPEPTVGHEEEELQPPIENVPEVEAQNVPQAVALEGHKEKEGQLFLASMKYIIQKRFIWRVIPLHMKKP